MDYDGGLKSLLESFNCIYTLFKTLVKTAALLYLKTRWKQAVSANSTLGCELASLLIFTRLYLFLTRQRSAVSAPNVCLMGRWKYRGVWGLFYCVSSWCHVSGHTVAICSQDVAEDFYTKLNICLQGPWGYEFAICMMMSEVRKEWLLVTACFSWPDLLWAWRPSRHPTKASCVTDLGWKMDGMPLEATMFPQPFHLCHYPAEVKCCLHLFFSSGCLVEFICIVVFLSLIS